MFVIAFSVSHDSSVGKYTYLTAVCPLRGPGSIPTQGGVFPGNIPADQSNPLLTLVCLCTLYTCMCIVPQILQLFNLLCLFSSMLGKNEYMSFPFL